MRLAGVALVVALCTVGCSGLLGLEDTHEVEADAADAVDVACEDGETEACYTGAQGTEDIGPCHGGTRRCVDGSFGACEDEVTPANDVCGNEVDEDCSGVADDPVDGDGDGFTNCGGDYCDGPGQGCEEPALVNPGAYDFAGDGVDDDCNGTPDDAVAVCDAGLFSGSADALAFARALDLCQFPQDSSRAWGVLDGALSLTDGTSAAKPEQHSIRQTFGQTLPQKAMSLAVLATGHAAATGQSSPAFAPFQSGSSMMTQSVIPADWLAANGGQVPSLPGCPAQQQAQAYDPVMLTLRIRVPTNARSFQLATNFMTTEFPEWLCTQFTDQFVVLLGSSWADAPANPADGNLARVDFNGNVYSINADLAMASNLFRVCTNPGAGCSNAQQGCVSAAELAGTGFDVEETFSTCNPKPAFGAATGWLTTSGNVVPGEEITLRIAVWDAGDQVMDSLALVDAFQWSPDTITPGTRAP